MRAIFFLIIAVVVLGNACFITIGLLHR